MPNASSSTVSAMTSETVNVDNFARAETDRMFAALQQQGGGVNVLHHHREPATLDEQPVIRQNRDTLYSSAVVDISGGANLTLPDSGGRYLSVMVVNEDHYINRILHEPGTHGLTVDEFDTDYVLVAARTLVDPNDPAYLPKADALNDRMVARALALGGTCTGEHGVGLGKIKFLYEEHGEAMSLMRSIKKALDPDNIMNPGKIIGPIN